jgi:RHS repeat-associated protein
VAENGQVVERYAYDPYGRAIVLNGEGDADGAEYTPDADGLSDVANVILFAGYRFDSESGLYHVRHRYLHPTLGRWIIQDPLGYVDGMNGYEYVGSSPIGARDPLGLEELSDTQLKTVLRYATVELQDKGNLVWATDSGILKERAAYFTGNTIESRMAKALLIKIGIGAATSGIKAV